MKQSFVMAEKFTEQTKMEATVLPTAPPLFFFLDRTVDFSLLSKAWITNVKLQQLIKIWPYHVPTNLSLYLLMTCWEYSASLEYKVVADKCSNVASQRDLGLHDSPTKSFVIVSACTSHATECTYCLLDSIWNNNVLRRLDGVNNT